MKKLMLAFFLVLVIMYVVPFPIYFALSVLTGLQPPDDDPIRFMISVLVTKIGISLTFVLIFHFARATFGNRWCLYAFAWWLMFFFGEIGQAIGPNYSWLDALGGVLSETVYCPLSAYVMYKLTRPR